MKIQEAIDQSPALLARRIDKKTGLEYSIQLVLPRDFPIGSTWAEIIDGFDDFEPAVPETVEQIMEHVKEAGRKAVDSLEWQHEALNQLGMELELNDELVSRFRRIINRLNQDGSWADGAASR